MTKSKKIVVLAMCMLMVLSDVACGTKEADDAIDAASTAVAAVPVDDQKKADVNTDLSNADAAVQAAQTALTTTDADNKESYQKTID